MKMATIKMDTMCYVNEGQKWEDGISTFSELKALYAADGIEATLIVESGPGGGWPIVEFKASREKLEEALTKYFDDDGYYAAEIVD
jgi:hypothetical protein